MEVGDTLEEEVTLPAHGAEDPLPAEVQEADGNKKMTAHHESSFSFNTFLFVPCTASRGRTGTLITEQKILSLSCLPIPTSRLKSAAKVLLFYELRKKRQKKIAYSNNL